MSNVLNKIHYAVEITTSTTETAEDIGLYEGVLRFVTDGYDPSDATYEDSSPVLNPTKWFDQFLTDNGVGTLGSKIDLSVGGDYSHLQNCEIDIVNYTTQGEPYHTRLNSIFSTIITGSTLKVYVIIDDVFYERWTGVVAGTRLSDRLYSFLGEDRFNNANDTLSGKTIGYVVGAEYTYFEAEALPYAKNVILRRFGPYWYGTPHIITYDESGALGLSGHPLSSFNGFANSSLGDIEPTGVKWLQIEKNESSLEFMNLQVEVGDLIRVNEGDNYYEVLSWDTYTGVSQEEALRYNIHINVRYFDRSLENYVSCFGDAEEFSSLTDPYLALADLSDAARLSFYKKADGTGIPSSMVTGDYVTIIDSVGNRTNMTYTVLGDGTIRLDDVAYTTKVKPTKVQIARTNVPVDWFTTTLQSISDIKFNDLTMANDLDSSSYFTPINDSGSETGNMVTSLFKLTFPVEILEQGGWKLGLMVRGIFENQNMNWDGVPFNTGIGWYNCQESVNWNGNPATPVNTSPGILFGSAEHLSGARFNNYSIKVFRVVKVYGGGTVKEYLQEVENFYLPNVVNTTSIISNNGWDKLNVGVESVTATNVFQTDPNVYSTALGIRHLSEFETPSGSGHYIHDAFIDFVDPDEVSEFEFVVSITGTDKDLNSETAGGEKTIKLTDELGVQTTYTTSIEDPVPHLNYTLNGFSLYRTELVDTSGSKINIIQNDVTTNSYPTTLEEVVGSTCDMTNLINRDEWLTGMQIKEPTPRFNIVTELCKQGFVAGYTSRKGIPTFNSFIESVQTPHMHSNSIVVDESMKNFVTTPISKVYNEFNLKWNLNNVSGTYSSDIKILNTKENSFPAKTDNWEEFVSGVPNYSLAASYWKEAHEAYLISKATNKAPSDRTELKYAYDNTLLNETSSGKFITSTQLTVTITETELGAITVGSVIKLPYETFIDESFIKVGDRLHLTDGTGSMECIVEADRVVSITPKFMCRVIKTTFSQVLTSIEINTGLSYVYLEEGEVIAGTRFTEPPVVIGNINLLEIREINQGGIAVGSSCFCLKTSLPNSALVNSTYRVTYYDVNESVNCYVDIRIVGEHDVNNWALEILALNGGFIQPYSNYFFFTGECSWEIQYFKSEVGTAEEFNSNKYISMYLSLLLNWTTYQKFQVNYDLPINPNTIRYELSDPVQFSDPIVTPNGLVGKGWINSISVDSKKSLIKLQVTFTPEFLVRPPVAMVCNNIIEHKDNVDTITENKNNTDTITEKYCPYSN